MILKDRVAIVTAAGSGIGRGGAEIMGREGAVVIATDLRAERAEETARRIRDAGGQAEGRALDITDDAAIAALIADVAQRRGRIDILHNHAGIQVEGSLEQVPAKGLDDSYKINVRAHFVAAKAALPHMKRQGRGVIINTSSNSGVFFDKGMLAYITSKTAVIAMTKQMALDYGPHNIRVNALCPGWVDTPFNDPYIRQMGGRNAIDAHVKDNIPMGRWASVDEIAESILYLASDRSSYMTGHALVIDGGRASRSQSRSTRRAPPVTGRPGDARRGGRSFKRPRADLHGPRTRIRVQPVGAPLLVGDPAVAGAVVVDQLALRERDALVVCAAAGNQHRAGKHRDGDKVLHLCLLKMVCAHDPTSKHPSGSQAQSRICRT